MALLIFYLYQFITLLVIFFKLLICHFLGFNFGFLMNCFAFRIPLFILLIYLLIISSINYLICFYYLKTIVFIIDSIFDL